MEQGQQRTVGAWAKKYYFASRAVIEATLRPYDLGSTQWYVLWHLVHDGPMAQRDLLTVLELEKATLSGVVSALVRKGFVDQKTGVEDQRQKLLSITQRGRTLWERLPDPIDLILTTAFADISEDDLETVKRVLSTGTQRLNELLPKGN